MRNPVTTPLFPCRPLYWVIGLIALPLIFLPTVQAQTDTPSTSRDVVKSVLPDFQTDASASGKKTEVTVDITVGEQGQVTKAESKTDKSTLGNSCVLAARQWIFIREIPPGTTGTLTFSFKPEGKVSAAVRLALKSNPQDPVPKPLLQTTTEEAQWWEDLRKAGSEIVILHKLRAEALRKVQEQVNKEIDRKTDGISSIQDKIAISSAVYKKFQPQFDAVHAEHNPKVDAAEDRFRGLLREGAQKSLNEPLPSHRPMVVQTVKAKYTEEARQNKVQGTVLLSIVMEASGIVSGIRVIRALPDGLTEKAIEAAQKLVFLPASDNGKFISVRGTLDFSFNLY